jgi:hypothetical protein
MKGAIFRRNAAAFFLLRSISYSVLPSPNRTVSSAGPPSRSSSSATVIFCAVPASPCCDRISYRTRSIARTRSPQHRQLPVTSVVALAQRHSARARRGRSGSSRRMLAVHRNTISPLSAPAVVGIAYRAKSS